MVELVNGSVINFRYIAQQGKNAESSTSNLLSSTFDYIVVDQIEDPEIIHKDFLDLLGRLRGNTPYVGNDPIMPTTGPRWFIITCNPTRNWVYRELVKPIQDMNKGLHNPKLLCDKEGAPIIEIFEGSTYENADNLAEDFIETLETTYKGQMNERYLMGKWGAFEGLVHPSYDASVHMMEHAVLEDYFQSLEHNGFNPTIVEAYDHGLAQQACYLQGFCDPKGNLFWFRGLYEREMLISEIAKRIKEERANTIALSTTDVEFNRILADPALFKRTAAKNAVGITVAGLFRDEDIKMTKANNAIISGLAKVNSYLHIDETQINPVTLERGSPKMFFSNDLNFIDEEITDYFWKKNTSAEYTENPKDHKDHAMNTIKYGLTNRPKIAQFVRRQNYIPNRLLRWSEFPDQQNKSNKNGHRYVA